MIIIFNAKAKASSTNNQNSCNTESDPLYIVASVILKLEKIEINSFCSLCVNNS